MDLIAIDDIFRENSFSLKSVYVANVVNIRTQIFTFLVPVEKHAFLARDSTKDTYIRFSPYSEREPRIMRVQRIFAE